MSGNQVKQELFSFIFPAVPKKQRQSRSNSAEKRAKKSRSRSRSRERIFNKPISKTKRISTTKYFGILEKQFAKNEFLTRLLIKLEAEINAIQREREVIDSSIELVSYLSQNKAAEQQRGREMEREPRVQHPSSNGGQVDSSLYNDDDEDQARLANFAEMYGRSEDVGE